MNKAALLGPWVRRFLMEHLVGERNLARNTQKAYRDTLQQLLPFAVRQTRTPVDRLEVEDLSASLVKSFLQAVEQQRRCGAATRNNRLAAIRSLANFIGIHSPEHVSWSGDIRTIPLKRAPRPLVTYLEKQEMDALLAAPDVKTLQGRRDHALLLFLYNSGARADEAAHLLIGDLHLPAIPRRESGWVLIHGKGNKDRRCPLWERAVIELGALVRGRATGEPVFLNRRGQALTRFGIHAMVERYAARLAKTHPSIAKKRVSPHTIRHTTATHLLRAGVDINTIRAWLGHVSLRSTNVYAEVDLEMKAKALANCEIRDRKPLKSWHKDRGLLEFLRAL